MLVDRLLKKEYPFSLRRRAILLSIFTGIAAGCTSKIPTPEVGVELAESPTLEDLVSQYNLVEARATIEKDTVYSIVKLSPDNGENKISMGNTVNIDSEVTLSGFLLPLIDLSGSFHLNFITQLGERLVIVDAEQINVQDSLNVIEKFIAQARQAVPSGSRSSRELKTENRIYSIATILSIDTDKVQGYRLIDASDQHTFETISSDMTIVPARNDDQEILPSETDLTPLLVDSTGNNYLAIDADGSPYFIEKVSQTEEPPTTEPKTEPPAEQTEDKPSTETSETLTPYDWEAFNKLSYGEALIVLENTLNGPDATGVQFGRGVQLFSIPNDIINSALPLPQQDYFMINPLPGNDSTMAAIVTEDIGDGRKIIRITPARNSIADATLGGGTRQPMITLTYDENDNLEISSDSRKVFRTVPDLLGTHTFSRVVTRDTFRKHANLIGIITKSSFDRIFPKDDRISLKALLGTQRPQNNECQLPQAFQYALIGVAIRHNHSPLVPTRRDMHGLAEDAGKSKVNVKIGRISEDGAVDTIDMVEVSFSEVYTYLSEHPNSFIHTQMNPQRDRETYVAPGYKWDGNFNDVTFGANTDVVYRVVDDVIIKTHAQAHQVSGFWTYAISFSIFSATDKAREEFLDQ